MPEHVGASAGLVHGRPTTCKDALAHCIDNGAQPSTVAASTPGTRPISSSTRSSSAGAAVCGVLDLRRPNHEGEQPVRIESQRRLTQPRIAAEQQPTANEQHDGQAT